MAPVPARSWFRMKFSEVLVLLAAGTLGGSVYTLTLKNEGLKIAYNPGYSLPADVKAAGDAAVQGIVNGTITVTP